jgi:hypothetical protein
MTRRVFVFAGALALLFAGVADAQLQIVDLIAEKVVQKYAQSTCEQLWEQRAKPKSQEEQQVIQMLRNDPQIRSAFIGKIVAPVANKMFECGMVP